MEMKRQPTEAQFRQAIIQLCEWSGHRVYSVRRSDLAILESRSAIGFPDLVIAGGGRLLTVELKVGRNQLEPDQIAWREALPAAVHRIWRPHDWATIENELRNRP